MVGRRVAQEEAISLKSLAGAGLPRARMIAPILNWNPVYGGSTVDRIRNRHWLCDPAVDIFLEFNADDALPGQGCLHGFVELVLELVATDRFQLRLAE